MFLYNNKPTFSFHTFLLGLIEGPTASPNRTWDFFFQNSSSMRTRSYIVPFAKVAIVHFIVLYILTFKSDTPQNGTLSRKGVHTSYSGGIERKGGVRRILPKFT